MPSLEIRFQELHQENRQKILRICHVYAWTPQDREDLYQEILFQIWRTLPSLKEPTYANTWLYRIALNTAISFVRKNAVSRQSKTPLEQDQLAELPDHRQQTKSQNPRIDALYNAIGKLDKMERAVMTLFLEEMSYEQIAEIMGLNSSHVGVMLHRAKKKLSMWLTDEVPV